MGDGSKLFGAARIVYGKFGRVAVLAAASLAIEAAPAAAQTEWTGGTSNNWFTAGNWNPAAVPNAATSVEIDAVSPNQTVINQAGAQALALSIGSAAGQTGNLTVTGASSTLAVGSGFFFVGDFGNGSFTVSNGATASAGGQTYVAVDPNGQGTMLVTGANSVFNANGGIFIAADNGAVGTVTVNQGGRLNGNATIGTFAAGSNGTLNIDGAGTVFNGGVTVGDIGTGAFNVTNGATATSNTIVGVASSSASGNGTVNISGAGSTWSTGNLLVGTQGTGAMNIGGGAVVTTRKTFATSAASVGGTATISGAGSEWRIGGDPTTGDYSLSALNIGKATGTPTVTVENGGKLTILSTATGTNGQNGDLRVASAANGSGALIVTGAGSTVTAPYNFYVGFGNNSNGTVTVSNGGSLNTGFSVIAAAGSTPSTGSVTVTGAGSVWNISDTPNTIPGQTQGLIVGSLGNATLTIANGGTVTVNSASGSDVILGGSGLGSSGILNIGAAAADPATAPGTLNADKVIFSSSANGAVTVNFNHTSNNYVFAPQITGSNSSHASVNVLAGTTIFTADNTYTGATNVSAGATMQLGNGGTTGSLTGGITNNGAVAFNRSDVVSYGGVITGGGTLEQKGSGTLILTGANTYTGVTTISSGTLQIGGTNLASGSAGSVTGDIVDNSALVFRRSNSIAYNGVISGSGSLTQLGTGNLTLGGASTYGGGTTISNGIITLGGNDRLPTAGSLMIANVGTFSLVEFNQTIGDLSGAGTVALGAGTLTAGTAHDTAFSGGMTGTGGFNKEGTGTLTFTGTKIFSGLTAINAGTLLVNGTDANSAVSVAAGATLGGNGTVGATTVTGNIAPGASAGTIGTLNTGAYVQATGSTYRVDLSTVASDLINVTGSATIQTGTTVNVGAAPGTYTVGTRYTILTSSDARTGTFSTLTDNLPFVDFRLAYDPNNVFLDVFATGAPFTLVAQSGNQMAVARAVEALGPGNALYNAVLPLDAPNARRAFDLFSGEVHASVTSTMLEESKFVRDAVTGRLRQSMGGAASIFAPQIAALTLAGEADHASALLFDQQPLAYSNGESKRARDAFAAAMPVKARPAQPAGPVLASWAQAFGNWGHNDGNGNAASLSRTTGGFFSGMDVTLAGTQGDAWRFGVAGGYQNTSLNVGARSSTGTAESSHIAVYAGNQRGALGLRGGAAYSWYDIDTTRIISLPGFSDSARSNYDGHTAQVFGEVGYAAAYRQFALEPFGSLAYVNVRTGGFVERGGAAALTGTGADVDTTFSTLGLRAAAALPWPGFDNLVGRAMLGWRHAFGTVTPTTQMSFAAGAVPFTVSGVPIARDAAAVELGVDGRVNARTTVGIGYTGQIADDAYDHSVKGNLLYRF